MTFPQLLEAIRLVSRTHVVAADVNEPLPCWTPAAYPRLRPARCMRELLLLRFSK